MKLILHLCVDWITTQNLLLKLTAEVLVHKLLFVVVEDMICLLKLSVVNQLLQQDLLQELKEFFLPAKMKKVLLVPESAIDVYLVRIGDELESFVSELAGKLRKENLSVDFDYLKRSVKAQMREANKMNAKYVLFIGGDEYKEGMMNLKNMSTGEEEKIS